MKLRAIPLFLFLMTVFSCGAGTKTGVDAGIDLNTQTHPDAGNGPDAGSSDAGSSDLDAGSSDAGSSDAGSNIPDAGTSDSDAGGGDAGVVVEDAGIPFSCGNTTCACNGEEICSSSDQCEVDSDFWAWAPSPDVPAASQYVVSCPDTANDCLVTDSLTGLVWQETIPSNPCPADGAGVCTQPDAVAYCASLSYGGMTSGWRLPSYPELYSIIDLDGNATFANASAFPYNMATDTYFWTSTPVTSLHDYTWGVYAAGGAYFIPTNDPGYVRCVR
jgi:hypothetical protein